MIWPEIEVEVSRTTGYLGPECGGMRVVAGAQERGQRWKRPGGGIGFSGEPILAEGGMATLALRGGDWYIWVGGRGRVDFEGVSGLEELSALVVCSYRVFHSLRDSSSPPSSKAWPYHGL